MRIAIIILCVALTSPAKAQVISGESTYEDNFVHTPSPAEADKPADRDAVTKEPDAPSRRDLHERDRD